jgi:hypothetical protein
LLIRPETQNKIYKSTSDLDAKEIRSIYNGFNSAIAEFDCGKKSAPHNPSGKPFCCDICHAVPAAYKSEWNTLEHSTDLWDKWHGNECEDTTPKDVAQLKADTPKNMVLLIGLANEWEFELVSAGSERLQHTSVERLPRFGFYK